MNKRIGLVVHNIHEEYSIELIRGVEKFCNENKDQLILFPISQKYAERYGFDSRLRGIKEVVNYNNLDGAVFSAGALCSFCPKEEYKESLEKLRPLPIVNIGMNIAGFPSVTSDSEAAFKKTIAHLIEKHNKTQFLLLTSNDSNYDSYIRKKWFLDVLKSKKIKIPNAHILNCEFNRLQATKNFNEYMNKNGTDFECVVCLNDTMALGVIEALTERGINIPDDIIVTGFDNSNRAIFSVPTLTTVDPRISEQGYQAAKILDAVINGDKTKASLKIESKERFRVSCGCISDSNFTNDSMDYDGNIHRFSKQEIYNIIHKLPQQIHNELYSLHQLRRNSLQVVNKQELLKLLPDYLNRISLEALAIFVYDKPKLFSTKNNSYKMPSKVKCMFKYEKQINDADDFSKEYFNPLKELFPPNLFKKSYNKIIVYPLFETNLQYGYVIAPLANRDLLFYEIVLETFSKEITSSIKIFNEEQTNTQLENSNSRLKKYSSLLTTLSTTDELTKINNRRGFINQATKAVKALAQSGKEGVIIFCDMDGLKKINDTYGHKSGDIAIKAEAEVLQNAVRSKDIIGRLGGDEFAIFAEGISKKNFARFRSRIEKETKKINQKLNLPFEISMSLGVAEISKDCFDLEKLLTIADKELYKEKQIKHAKQ
ncbi:GGDEF domain-containing protein [Treponema sp.]|uniref:substrate-binding and GGDEF domain-containing protein n=1 Tax=Treponema sp. TaxID=166 RepID=UPI00298E14C1|nr:GGDEF domain-containing protein [Treponema sp.]MCR5614420.1 GGDEF domain-containing protein [Treponema sp.]